MNYIKIKKELYKNNFIIIIDAISSAMTLLLLFTVETGMNGKETNFSWNLSDLLKRCISHTWNENFNKNWNCTRIVSSMPSPCAGNKCWLAHRFANRLGDAKVVATAHRNAPVYWRGAARRCDRDASTPRAFDSDACRIVVTFLYRSYQRVPPRLSAHPPTRILFTDVSTNSQCGMLWFLSLLFSSNYPSVQNDRLR